MAALGFLAVLASALFYGSYFVPAKKYDIRDGLVFQWYQCSGIMLAGLICAMVRNVWADDFRSSGFYVAPEGLISGSIFVIGNIVATISVKACGLGNYYTVHQLSNLGLTFAIGVYGKNVGVQAEPPKEIGLAFLGFVFVLLGMTPVMFMEKDGAMAEPKEMAKATPVMAELPMAHSKRSVTDLFHETGAISAIPEHSEVGVSSRLADRITRPAKLLIPDFREVNSLTWDGTLGRPQLHDEPLSPPLSCLGDMSMVAKEVSSEYTSSQISPAAEPLLAPEDDGFRKWVGGLLLSLVAGVLYSAMYVPQLLWKTRLQLEGYKADGIDFFYSMTVGVYVTSTAWLLCGGAYRKYLRQSMEKSVLRPALLSGLLYGCAVLCFLYAMMVLPYAIGYALGCGGGLAVSLLWGVLAFGEASSRHNKLCVMWSFLGVCIGIILLGASA
ncbi:unnamed protein product [Effrenium voratum]|nr:unnamed protein product [Effrenium voratum]